MNVDQHAVLQGRILDAQRLALDLCELGHSKVGMALGQAAFKAMRIKPTAEVAQASKPGRSKSKPVKPEGEGA